MFKGIIKALSVLAVSAFLLVRFLAAPQPQLLNLGGSTMGTTWNVQLRSTANANNLAILATEISQLLTILDKEVFSTYSETSEISRLNQAPVAQAQPLSAEMLQVLLAAVQVYEASEHAFDISVAPLVNVWGFGPAAGEQGIPDPLAIAAAMAMPGMSALELNSADATMVKLQNVQLDLSGIAKGYAVDRVADLLLTRGETDFLVEIGGEIRAQGWRADKQPWTLAIEKPQVGKRAVFTTISNHGLPLAVAGSGDYRNYRIVAGMRYSHEIDPRTGYPVQHQLAAVTVVASTAMLADAWATALMVLGEEKGLALADSLQVDAYFIMHGDNAVYEQPDALRSSYTEGFAKYLQRIDEFVYSVSVP